MKPARRPTLDPMGILLLAAFFVPGAPALAGYTLTVPRLDPSTAAPFVDGVLDDTYTVTIPVLYEPRISWPPAKLGVLSTSTHLYVCLAGMPLKRTSVEGVASVVIDTNHDGGSRPQADDIEFSLVEDGTKAGSRGNGFDFSRDFSLDPGVAGWSASRSVTSDSWSAEFRIPLALLSPPESPRAYPNVGFLVRHNGPRGGDDNFLWPPSGVWYVPYTWADIAWKVASKPGEAKVEVDVYRVTQGLDYDVDAGVAYDLIAGKDTLLRAQLFTYPGPAPDLTHASCRFQRLALSGSPGPLQTVPVSDTTTPKLNTYAYGYFNGKPYLNFWIPGTMVFEPGTYGFEIEIGLEGIPGRQTVLLGHKVFKQASDLRVLLLRAELPPESTRYRAWDFATNVAVNEGLKQFQRMMPIRSSGIGAILWSGGPRTASTPGLRFSYLPTILRCPTGTAFGDCGDGMARAQANDALARLNAQLAKDDATDGGNRDRFDRAIALLSEKISSGGLCCVGFAVRASVDDNADLISGAVMAHEVSHNLGQVRSTSPHYFSSGGNHTRNQLIPIFNNLRMVNMLSRLDEPKPLALMYPSGSAFDPSGRFIHEGYEWNDLRTSRLGPAGGSFAVGEPTFHVLGGIDRAMGVHVAYSARIDDVDLELTPLDEAGPYEVVFIDGQGSEMGRYPFGVRFENDDGGQETAAGLSLTVPLLQGSGQVALLDRQTNTVLYSQSFTAGRPSVSEVVAAPFIQGGGMILSWSASDPDSQLLRCNVYFQPSQEDVPVLLAAGLTETFLQFSSDMLPATPDARLIVEASDGYNTAKASSNSFRIDPKEPVAAIHEPTAASDLVAGQPAALRGSGFDLNDGPLTGNALLWTSSRDGFLGAGEEVFARLSEGLHTLFLEARASSGSSAVASADVFVSPDADGDGMPDAYEAQYPCLSSQMPDGEGDPDGDGLASRAERANGTDPCRADSDVDGVSDGDEPRLGSDPLNALSFPLPDLVFLSTSDVDLGFCPAPETKTVMVQASPNSPWTTWADADWIQVAREGPGGGCLAISARCIDLPPAEYSGQVLVSTPGSQLRVITVRLSVGGAPVGGLQQPGDCNQDGEVDISDGICLFGYLFLGNPHSLPCGDGTSADPANRSLLNHNGDGGLDISDGVALLNYLFASGFPPAGGVDCARMQGCPDRCAN